MPSQGAWILTSFALANAIVVLHAFPSYHFCDMERSGR